MWFGRGGTANLAPGHSPIGKALSLRLNFSWHLGGTLIYNLSQWLLVVVLARLAGPAVVGQYVLASAVAMPIFLGVGMNLPVVIATDARRVFSLRDYFRARVVLTALSFLLTMVVGVIIGMSAAELAVLAAVAGCRVAEAYAQAGYGYFQLRGRLDMTAKSMSGRGVVGVVAFALGFLASGELLGACLAMLASWFLAIVAWDRVRIVALAADDPAAKLDTKGEPGQTRRIIAKSWPLGIDAGSRSLALNAPRYAIQWWLGSASLGVFAALANFALAISLVTAALSAPVVPVLSRHFAGGHRTAFIRLHVRLVAFAAAIALAGVVGAVLVGELFVRLVFGPAFVNQPLLIALMIGYGVAVIQTTISQGLQAAQRFGQLAALDAVTLGILGLLSFVLVRHYGEVGAAAALGIGMAISGVAAVVLVGRAVPDEGIVD
ncbi:MAG: lipopolysaccharide biosynthesis protein [Candidatus Nanopelagicales bacterium]